MQRPNRPATRPASRTPARAILAVLLALALVAALAACAEPEPTATPEPTAEPTATPEPTAVADGTAYFLVTEYGETPLADSYVLPVSDPAQVAEVRAFLAEREKDESLGRIVVARIAPGSGDGTYVNRDVASGSGLVYSWHVTEFVGFADMTAEILDGWPGKVEEDVDAWIANTQGMIGFWSYTVTSELTPDEVAP